jgi:hypothetical protein
MQQHPADLSSHCIVKTGLIISQSGVFTHGFAVNIELFFSYQAAREMVRDSDLPDNGRPTGKKPLLPQLP